MKTEMNSPIVFYDGDCGFCNRSVQFILDHERISEIYFAAIQSEFTRGFFAERQLPLPDLTTFCFWDGTKMYTRSSAALKVLNEVRFPYSLGKVGWLVPRLLRDGVYHWIAKRRHRLFKGMCVLPDDRQHERFLS